MGIIVAVLLGLGWLAALLLVGPMAWSSVSPRIGFYAARRIRPLSPRFADWYERRIEEIRVAKRERRALRDGTGRRS